MTIAKPFRFKPLTLLSAACFLVATAIVGLWIYAFQTGDDQQERVQIYLSYFPPFLGLWGITAVQVLLSGAAIVISSICLKLPHPGWKLLNVAIIAFSSLVVLLNIWGQL